MATKAKVRKCHICGVRPATTEQGYCHNCQSQLDADRRSRRPAKPFRYVTYRGITVGLHRHKSNGDTFKAEFITKDPEKLPKSRMINLDTYCTGFTREQIKKLKRLCLSFAK
mgnify:CR=1 FL=1